MTDDDIETGDDRAGHVAVDLISDRLNFLIQRNRGKIRPEDGLPINQKNLAAYAGVTAAYISKLLGHQNVRVSFATVERIASYFGIPTDVFRADFPWSDEEMSELCDPRDAMQEREWRAKVRYRISFMLECRRGKFRPEDGTPWTLQGLAHYVKVKTLKYREHDVEALVARELEGPGQPSLANQYDLLAVIAEWFHMETKVLLPSYHWVDATIAVEMEAADLLANSGAWVKVWAARHGDDMDPKAMLGALRAMRDWEVAQAGDPGADQSLSVPVFKPPAAPEEGI